MIQNNQLLDQFEINLKDQFKRLDQISFKNQERVLSAFRKCNISSRHFNGTTGYGYDDIGRDTLRKIYCEVFDCEDAVISPLITCGTHALTIGLYALLRPNDTILSISGSIYDTLDKVINGEQHKDIGSLKDFNIHYNKIDLLDNGEFDVDSIKKYLSTHSPKIVYIQRSRGYEWRDAISVEKIEIIIKIIRNTNKQAFIVVDNCYGEFVETKEPSMVGADLIIGSLIKNIGGGLAPTGGYLAGTRRAVELVENRFISPALGMEVGSLESGYRLYYQGLFMAPHTVNQALKGSYLIGEVMKHLGYQILPESNKACYDIIKSIKFNTEQELIKFVQLIQKYSPIDSFVVPEQWEMPGYKNKVIMAAGTFVGGASIELSCDSPIKKPYIAYFQGGLTYEHIKVLANGILNEFKNT